MTRGGKSEDCYYKTVLAVRAHIYEISAASSQVSSVFLTKEFLRKKFQAIDVYRLNHAVESLVVGTLFLVNQPLIDVFLFNTPNNKGTHCCGALLMKVRVGVKVDSWLTLPGDPRQVGDGLRFSPSHPLASSSIILFIYREVKIKCKRKQELGIWQISTGILVLSCDPLGRGPSSLRCPVFRPGLDLQHDAGQRISVGQVGKTALSRPLICKHGPNIFSACPLSVMSDGGERLCYISTFHSAMEKLLLVNVLKENSFVPGVLANLENLVLSDKHFPSYESRHGVFLLRPHMCRQQRKEADRHLRQQGLPASVSSPGTDGPPHVSVSLPPIWKSLWRPIWWLSTLKKFFNFVLGYNQLTGGSAVQNLPAVQETEKHGFDPRVRKIPWRRKWQPTPLFI